MDDQPIFSKPPLRFAPVTVRLSRRNLERSNTAASMDGDVVRNRNKCGTHNNP